MSDIEIPSEAKDRSQKAVGLTIAVLAVLLAVVSSLGNSEDNEKIVNEVKASNHYAWYQAKRIREAMNDIAVEQLRAGLLAGNATSAQQSKVEAMAQRYQAKNLEYKAENAEIQQKAHGFMNQAALSARKGDRFDLAEVFLQVAVVLCSVTLLTNQRGFFRSGLLVAAVGVAVGITAFTITEPPEVPSKGAHVAPIHSA